MKHISLDIRRVLFLTTAVLVVFLKFNPALALFCGIFISFALGPLQFQKQSEFTKFLLGLCVVGLAAGIKMNALFELGTGGLFIVCAAVFLSFICGFVLTKLFRIPNKLACLLTVGTAICGGSAIVAVSPIIDADSKDLGTSIAIVFLLNAVAMVSFPLIGHHFEMSQLNFGLWSAVAIHDTASVIGTAVVYGNEAVAMATSAKLTRTLFLIPVVAVLLSYMHRTNRNNSGARIPWFVKGFAVVLLLGWAFPGLWGVGSTIADTAKRLIILALFLVGANIKVSTLRQIEIRPMVFATTMWIFLASLYLYLIVYVV